MHIVTNTISIPVRVPGLRTNPLRLLNTPEETKRMLPHRPTEDGELEAPTVENHALGLMLILGVAVAQNDRCHLVRHLRMPRAR